MRILDRVVGLLDRLNFCGRIGAFAGVLIGFAYGALQLEVGRKIDPAGAALAGLVLSLFAIAMALIVYGVLERYGIGTVAIPIVVVSLLTGVLTALVLNAGGVWQVSPLIGLVIGALVGTLVCQVRCGGLRGRPRDVYLEAQR